MGSEFEVKFTSTREVGVQLLEGFKQGESEVMKGPEYLNTVRKAKRARTVQPGEKIQGGILPIYVSTQREGAKRTEPGCFQ